MTTSQTSPAPTTSPTMSSHTLNSAFTRGGSIGSRAATLPRMLEFHPGPDRLPARPAPRLLVRDRLRAGSRGRLPGHGPAGAAGRRGADILGNGMIIVAIAALIGGRLYHVIDQWALYQDDPIKIFLPPYSGSGRLRRDRDRDVAAFLYARYKRVPFLRWADIVAPGLFVMQAIARWGNFFNQELYGTPTTLPWGIPIDCAHRISRLPVRPGFPASRPLFHPLFLYESVSGAARRARSSIWLGFHCPPAAAPGRPAARCSSSGTAWSASSSRRLRAGQLDVLRGPDRADRVAAVRHPGALHPRLAPPPGPSARRSGEPIPRARRGARSGGRSSPAGRRRRAGDDDVRRRGRRRRRAERRRRPSDEARAEPDGRGEPADRTRGADVGTRPPTTESDAEPRPRCRPPGPAPRLTWPTRPSASESGRRRPPPGRVSPEALAAPRGGAVEGLAWLGRPPEAKASILVPAAPARRAVRAVRRLPVPDPDVRPGAPARAAATSWSPPRIAAGWTRSW